MWLHCTLSDTPHPHVAIWAKRTARAFVCVLVSFYAVICWGKSNTYQQQHIQDRVRFWSSSKFPLSVQCEHCWCQSQNTLCRILKCLDCESCTLSVLRVYERARTIVKVWWSPVRSPSSPSTLTIKSTEAFSIACTTRKFSCTRAWEHQLLACYFGRP